MWKPRPVGTEAQTSGNRSPDHWEQKPRPVGTEAQTSGNRSPDQWEQKPRPVGTKARAKQFIDEIFPKKMRGSLYWQSETEQQQTTKSWQRTCKERAGNPEQHQQHWDWARQSDHARKESNKSLNGINNIENNRRMDMPSQRAENPWNSIYNVENQLRK